MTDALRSGGTRQSDDAAGSPTGDDPVRQAREWLAERGIVVPEVLPDGDRSPRAPARPADRQGLASEQSSSDLSAWGQLASEEAQSEQPASAEAESAEAQAAETGSCGVTGPRSTGGGEPLDPDADPEAVARSIVLRKLAAQARTRAELSRALKVKQVPEDAAEAVLDRMEAVGLVDDHGFAHDWVESRQQRRYLSKSALRRELSGKGVDREVIDSALEQVEGPDELRAARALVTKKLRGMADLDAQVRYRRLAGMLARRGFNPGVIVQAVADSVVDSDGGGRPMPP